VNAPERVEAETLLAAISRLGPVGLSRAVLPDAGEELTAARREAADAVSLILAAVEDLLSIEATDVEAWRVRVAAGANAILEACAYQDITGQRLDKVARIIGETGEGLARLAQASGAADASATETAAETRRRELHLNGPALSGPSVSQTDIDALFD
jgi:chemotaxis protein CheZ